MRCKQDVGQLNNPDDELFPRRLDTEVTIRDKNPRYVPLGTRANEEV